MPIPFSKWLSARRSEKKMTLFDLESASGVTYTHISKLELGKARASRDVVIRIAGGLGESENDALIAAGFVPYDTEPYMTDVDTMRIARRFFTLSGEEKQRVWELVESFGRRHDEVAIGCAIPDSAIAQKNEAGRSTTTGDSGAATGIREYKLWPPQRTMPRGRTRSL